MAYVALDGEGRIEEVSRVGLGMLGRRREDVVGRAWVELLAVEQRGEWAELVQGARGTGGWEGREFTVEGVDGGRVSVSVAGRFGRERVGREGGLHLVLREVTGERQAREALRQSEERYRVLFEEGTEGMAVADAGTGILLDCNKALLEMVGYRKEELVGQPQAVLHAPEDVDAGHSRSFQAHRASEPGAVLLAHLQTKDGVRKAVEIKARALEVGGRKVIQGFFRDVTEREHAAEALKESEERYRLLFNGITDAVFVHEIRDDDLPGAFLAVNDAMCRRLGYAREELLRMTVLDIDAPESTADRQSVVRRLRGGESVLFGQIHVARDGRRIPVEVHVQAFRLQGRLVVLSVSRDTTERQVLEAQLRQAQKIEAIGQLAGGVAHDFNNILTVILGSAGLMAEAAELTPASRDLARQVAEAAERGANLTRQLLAFSRKQVMQVRALDVQVVLGQVLKMLQRVLGEDITLQCNYVHDLPMVMADAGMLEQVIMNLAVNARDAMRGGGRLVVTTALREVVAGQGLPHAEARPGRYVALSMADTGSGMSAETQARIFEPFFTTKEVGRGTGLGLATVYGIVKQHGGWVEVSSELGRGSTFTVVFPVAKDTPAGEELSPRLEEVRGGNETVLLVEDDAMVRNLVRHTLHRRGYRVLEAADGPEAIRCWDEQGPTVDLLLTDMVMPGGMSGRDLATELRRRRPDLKVIFSSGYSREPVGQIPELRRGDRFLAKPYDPGALALLVRELLDGV